MLDLSIFNGAVLTLEVYDESTGAFDYLLLKKLALLAQT
jgi:hypothetical protein